MKFIRSLAASIVACSALISATGCNDSSVADTTAPAKSAPSDSVDRVSASQPERKTLTLHTSQPGRVEAFEETPLYPKVTGYVEEVFVDIGDSVEKGQKLIQLWIPEMQDEQVQKEALVAQAAAEVQQAEAAVQASEAATLTAKARVSQAEAGIGRTDGDYERWKSEYERIRELADKGSVTPKLADEALNHFRSAEAARAEATAHVESAEAGFHEAQANVSKSQADLVAAQARHRVAEANLKQTKTMLAYAEIKAPFDGVVTRRSIDTGHFVHPASGGSTQPLLVVARSDKVRISVDVPEMEAPLVDKGDTAIVRVQSLRKQEIEAAVTRTSWSLDNANRSLRTEIDVLNDEELLRPGMFATVTILLDERSDVLTLPITAIFRDGPQTSCCCVESGKIERRPIVLGLRSGDEVEVVSGLTGDESIVITRADVLQQGQPVEIIEAGK
ncbi:MAG: efflux RND transporter periplasmic adaptor subunit [Planctomycetaceae bacterium]